MNNISTSCKIHRRNCASWWYVCRHPHDPAGAFLFPPSSYLGTRIFPKGASPGPACKRSPDDIAASPSSWSPAGNGQEVLARAASVVCSFFPSCFCSAVWSTKQHKAYSFLGSSFLDVIVDEEGCTAWSVFCIAINQGMGFSKGLLSCIKL